MITSISVLSPRHSKGMHLIATSRQGIRFYFRVGTFENGKRKVLELHLSDIRMPPATIKYDKIHVPECIYNNNYYLHNFKIDVAIAEGTPDKLELQNIRTCYVNNDVCILINGSAIERDNIICLCRDFIINRFEDKNQPIYYSESLNTMENVEKIYDIIEVSNDSLYPSKRTNNEMINEYLDTKQKYLLLTRNGIKVFERIFPINQLLNV